MNEKLLLRATDLSAGYGGEDVIKKLSFELERGEILCVVGESGCGKTTLLRALLGSAGRAEALRSQAKRSRATPDTRTSA